MAKNQSPLFLHEEVMLLLLRDETGVMKSGAWYGLATGGAILSELLLAGRIEIDDGKKPLVNVVNRKPMGDAVIDECLEKVAGAKRRANAQSWVSRFAHLKHLHHRVARGLCDRRILRNDVGTVLLIFKRKVYPEINPRPEKELIERLRKAIFGSSRTVDARTTILVALTNSVGLLATTFDRKKLKERKKRIDQLVDGNLAGKATKDAVQAAQTATTMAAIMPGMMVAVTAG